MGLSEIRKLKEQALLPKAKKVYQIPKKSAKKIAMEKLEQKVEIVKPKKAGWFDAERVELDGSDEFSFLPKEFKPSKEMIDEANNIVKKPKDFVGKNELGEWFLERRKEMIGKCWHCNGKTMKDDNAKFHYSVAHILPKKLFPSVATHEFNFIELCYYNQSCHKNFDDGMLSISDLNCFDQVIQRVAIMYPMIAKEERKRIPPILLEYIKTEL